MEALFIGCAYLVGSIPFGVIVARTHGVDLRAVGSGNIGATNVARAVGKAWGVVTLLLDAAKGFVPTILALEHPLDPWFVVATGLAAFVGHLFPVFLRFRGGKGVATALGVFAALAPIPAAISLGAYAIVYAATRVSSLGSLSGAVVLPVSIAIFGAPTATVALSIVLSLAVFIRHHENIRRLLSRTEKRV